MNVKLLRRIQKHILAEPRRYDQNAIICTDKQTIRHMNKSVPSCGTMACIGGWAYVLGKNLKKLPVMTDEEQAAAINTAQKLLGLDSPQRNRLFAYTWASEWPGEFIAAYNKARTPLQKAKVAVLRIDHFIKTKGAE